MKKINLTEKNVEVKTSLDEITISDFENLLKISTQNQYEDEIEKTISLMNVLTNLNVDEIEELDLEDFKKLSSEVSVIGLNDIVEVKNVFELEGKTYKPKAPVETFKLNIREILILKTEAKKNSLNYISKLAAVIYNEVLEDGKLKLTDADSIDEKSKKLAASMTMNYISNYLISLAKYFEVNV